MYKVSDKFLTAIGAAGGRTFRAAVTINGKTFDDNNIAEIDLIDNCNPTESFMLGGTGSTELDVTLFNLPSTLVLANAPITATISTLLSDNTWEDVPLGVFTVETPERNKNKVKLTCFDNMYKLEKAYFSDLTYPANIIDVAKEICSKAGVELADTVSLPDTKINKIEGYTCREAIGFIASFVGGFAHFNRIGKLEIKSYTDTEVKIDGNIYFDPLKLADGVFTIGSLVCKAGNETLTAGSGGNEVDFENPIMTQNQLNNIYNTLKTLSYMPYNMSWEGNQALEAGDKITIVSEDDTKTYNTLIMQNKIIYTGGIKAETSAVGKSETGQNFDSGGSMKNTVERTVIEQANIKLALINKATIDDLKTETARIDKLYTNVGEIQTLVAGNISAANIQTGFITAGCGLIAKDAIEDAMIANVSAGKINTGILNTSLVTVQSNSGNMSITDNTIQIKDTSRVRVQIGKDASSDYNMYVWDASGNLMFDAAGLKANGIKDKIIRDDMVSDTANIDAKKINIDSLFSQINGSSNTLKASKIYLDTQAQMLDAAFTSLTSTVTSQGNDIKGQGTAIQTIQGQISSKIWEQDITGAIDSVQIGGRNLVQDFTSPKWNLKNGILHQSAYKNHNVLEKPIVPSGYNDSVFDFLAVSGIKYTFSAWIKGIIQIFLVPMKTVDDSWNPTTTEYQDNYHTINGGSDYSYQYFTTFTTPSDTVRMRLLIRSAAGTTTDTFISMLKVELGNKPTDWTPAPEDVQTQITTLNSNYSSLNQTVNGFQSTVSSVKTTIDNMQIGGRNLLRNSGWQKDILHWENVSGNYFNLDTSVKLNGQNTVKIDISGQTSYKGYWFRNSETACKPGDTFTGALSIMTDNVSGIDSSAPSLELNFLDANGNSLDWNGVNYDGLQNNAWQRKQFTATAPANAVKVCFSFFLIQNGRVWIACPMLAEGNKILTDWTPAPEDVQTQIDSHTTEISQLSTSISSKVDVNGVISTIKQNPDAVEFAFNQINSAKVKIDAEGLHVKGGEIDSADFYAVYPSGNVKMLISAMGGISYFTDGNQGTLPNTNLRCGDLLGSICVSELDGTALIGLDTSNTNVFWSIGGGVSPTPSTTTTSYIYGNNDSKCSGTTNICGDTISLYGTNSRIDLYGNSNGAKTAMVVMASEVTFYSDVISTYGRVRIEKGMEFIWSEYVSIQNNQSQTINHNLGHIPIVVLSSDTFGNVNPLYRVDANNIVLYNWNSGGNTWSGTVYLW